MIDNPGRTNQLKVVLPRLARLDRIYVCHPIYFVTASTADRKRILAHPRIHAAVIAFAQEGPAHGAWIGRYVLMPDHCNLFVACDHERISLSAWAKSFKNALSAELRRIGIESPHWQKGFRSPPTKRGIGRREMGVGIIRFELD